MTVQGSPGVTNRPAPQALKVSTYRFLLYLIKSALTSFSFSVETDV